MYRTGLVFEIQVSRLAQSVLKKGSDPLAGDRRDRKKRAESLAGPRGQTPFQHALGGVALMSQPASYPVTIIVRSPRENPKKCSVLPLRGRADFTFLTYPVTQRLDLQGYIR